jgi:hypothetical protein
MAVVWSPHCFERRLGVQLYVCAWMRYVQLTALRLNSTVTVVAAKVGRVTRGYAAEREIREEHREMGLKRSSEERTGVRHCSELGKASD